MTLNQLKERIEGLIADGHGLKRVLLRINNQDVYEAYTQAAILENDDVVLED